MGLTWTSTAPRDDLVRYNPCGRLVDWRRVPFRSKVRPFRNSENDAGVIWIPVAPGALPLRRVSVIAVPDWDDVYWTWAGAVGEYTAPLSYSNQRARPGTGRGHVCGSDQDFEEGGDYDTELAPVTYGASGLPTCCAAPVVGAGGMVLGGFGSVGFITRPVARGGLVLGGRGDVVYYPPGPDGGSGCADAPLIPLGATVHVDTTTAAHKWYRFTADGTHSYDFVAPGEDETTLFVSAWTGTCPGGLSSVFTLHGLGSDTWTFSTPPAGDCWVEVAPVGSDHTFDFSITEV